MKNIIFLLVTFIIAVAGLNAEDSKIKVYQQDGSVKTYSIIDIEEMSFIKADRPSFLTIYRKEPPFIITYKIIDVEKINYSSVNNLIILIIDGQDIKYNLASIDSITFIQSGNEIKSGMVFIPAGTFQMGNTGEHSGNEWEKPLHTVTISKSFYMSKYEISQKQYEEVMGINPSYFKGVNLPVEQVSWYDAVEFCNKLSLKEGLSPCYSINGTNVICNFDANGYRLPTEAEWEYAAKAGTTTDFYSGSLSYEQCSPLDYNLDRIGWYCGNSDDKTHPLGQKEPNASGLYDMSGNVWEWCWDWYGEYSNVNVTDPKGENSGYCRVLRGGSWYYFAYYCRSARRYCNSPENRFLTIGFRVVYTF